MDYTDFEIAVSALNQTYEESTKRQAALRASRCQLEKEDFVVFDEKESVAWNREQRTKKIRSLRARESAEERAVRKEEDKVNNILLEILKNEYSIPPAVASVIIARAKEDGHAYGWYEVLSKAQTYAEFAEEILEAANEPRN